MNCAVDGGEEGFLFSFQVASIFLLLAFSPLPSGIGLVFPHRFSDDGGLFTEILLIYDSILVDDEGHYS